MEEITEDSQGLWLLTWSKVEGLNFAFYLNYDKIHITNILPS